MAQLVSFVCGSCRKSYKKMTSFRRHKCKRNQPQCDRCGKVFGAWKNALATHTQTHLIEDQEERKKEKEQRRRIEAAAARKLLKREERQRQKQQIRKLEASKRMKNVRKPRVFVCDDCGAELKNPQTMAKHVARGFDRTCNVCGKKFPNACGLFRHKQTPHELPKSTCECDHCSKQFKWKSLMVDHIRASHLKIIRFRCQECGATFYKKGSYESHMEQVHWRNKEFICDSCGLLSSSKCSIVRHCQVLHSNTL